jgi:hypothetical protein
VNWRWFIQLLFLRCVLLLVQKSFERTTVNALARVGVVRWKALGTFSAVARRMQRSPKGAADIGQDKASYHQLL